MYDATVLEVFIASPSDTSEQRAAIHDVVVRWNETESSHLGVVLLPIMWETHAYSDMGAPAQPVINRQIADRADIVIATFWTTLGSPTAEAKSGTVEEVERARTAGKHVLLHFCDMPVAPLDNDTTMLDELRTYREQMKGEGLFSSYSSIAELRDKIRVDLTRLVHDRVANGDLFRGAPALDGASVLEEAPESSVKEALDEIRRELRGYVAKWQSIVESFDADPSADTRQSLATEVERVARSVIQLVSTVAPEAPVLQTLPALARDAHVVAATMLYLDGGKSFRELTDGCTAIVQRASDLIQHDWESQ